MIVRDDSHFEWYQSYSTMQPIWQRTLGNQAQGAGDHILVVGCGTSSMQYHRYKQCHDLLSSGLSEELYDSGRKHITNIDASEVVIQILNQKYNKTRPEMSCKA